MSSYRDGKVTTAENHLSAAIDQGNKPPAERANLLQALLTICTRADNVACVAARAPQYLQAIDQSPAGGQVQHERGRQAVYFLQYAAFSATSGEAFLRVVDPKRLEWGFPGNGTLYLRQKLLAAQVYVWADRPADALRQVDKALSLIASLKNPEDGRVDVAWGLIDAIDLLVQIGDTERAFGLYQAAAPAILAILPPKSVDAVRFHYAEAQLLERVGMIDPAAAALDRAMAVLDGLEISPGRREALSADLYAYKAVFAVLQDDSPAAETALRRHPFAILYTEAGRRPATDREISYLAARALVSRARGAADPVAAAALGAAKVADFAPEFAVYRQAGVALAGPAGPDQNAAMTRAGAQLLTLVNKRPSAGLGAWYRPGLIDQLIATLALSTAADPSIRNAETIQTAFGLSQLLSRRGATFDADAMAALASAADESQRASIHQALRLRARRDQAERADIQTVARLAVERGPAGAAVEYDPKRRAVYREFSDLLRQAQDGLSHAVWTSGANLVALNRLQKVLSADEAALSVFALPGGRVVHLCVRSKDAVITQGSLNPAQSKLDVRMLQAALTAGHAPSEALDAQYPVAASVRLYDTLLRPFEGCLRPNGKVLWLPNLSSTPVPLAALLASPPPKLAQGAGFDLAAADWFVSRQAVAYAGSAAVVVAARGPGAGSGGDLDFLGVGDPVFSGSTAAGEDRGAILRSGQRGGRLSDLQPLPETADELRRSAAGFGSVRILTGEAATEANLRQQLVGSYSYISLATHGLLRDDVQGLSDPALALTPVSAARAQDDGLLTASEIADLTLRARFVALSACNTANYDLTQASTELPALASAFAVAGTPATLGTLWPVDSATSAAVVTQTFGNLKRGQGPAVALAEAQRAFLGAPPTRAHLHPRFWAPFVLLGDGGVTETTEHGLSLTRVDLVDGGEGEVIALSKASGATAAQFTSAADRSGRHGAGLRTVQRSMETWRTDRRDVGATRVLIRLGDALIAGRYDNTGGAIRAAMDAYDAESGRLLGSWAEPAVDGLNSFVLAGVALDKNRAAVAVSSLNFDANAERRARLRVMEVGINLSPRLLFEVDVPKGVSPTKVTLVRLGSRLLLTYGEAYPAGPMSPAAEEDDFDYRICSPGPVAHAELREIADGRLAASARWDAVVLDAAASGDSAVLSGQIRSACGEERRAAVWRVGEDLGLTPLWHDASSGESLATAIGVAPGGRLIVGALKRSVVDRRADTVAAGWRYSVMLVQLTRGGRASPPKMLHAGGDVLVSAIDASDPNDIQVGGALGGSAAIFHLKTGGQIAFTR
jgi:CHAT domain-containing protein/tetratricopeptide (TPR) repeat protein